MSQNRLYGELSYLWPLISPVEEYVDEAEYWKEALRTRLRHGRSSLLELGVGGGHLLSHLTNEFQASAVDLSQNMLRLSAKLNSSVDHHLGDMRSARLGRKFDAVLIHDAIGYMLTEDDLRAAFATAKDHLKTGGVFITAPEWFTETFTDPSVLHWTRQTPGGDLTTIEYLHDPDPSDTTVESLFFYIFRLNSELRVEQDRHVMGLFSLDQWHRLMEEAGFVVEDQTYPPDDAGFGGHLLIGTMQ